MTGAGGEPTLSWIKPRPAEIHSPASRLTCGSPLTIHVSWVSIWVAINCFRALKSAFVQYSQVLFTPQWDWNHLNQNISQMLCRARQDFAREELEFSCFSALASDRIIYPTFHKTSISIPFPLGLNFLLAPLPPALCTKADLSAVLKLH